MSDKTWDDMFLAARRRGEHIDSAANIAELWEMRQRGTASPDLLIDDPDYRKEHKVMLLNNDETIRVLAALRTDLNAKAAILNGVRGDVPDRQAEELLQAMGHLTLAVQELNRVIVDIGGRP